MALLALEGLFARVPSLMGLDIVSDLHGRMARLFLL
jgi:hypothetical protein